MHSEEIMSDRAEALLMIASRAQLTDKVILPHLLNGRWMIADRYADSTLAYQGGGRGLNSTALEEINYFGTYTLKPDLTFFIDISVEEANKRMSVSRDRIEKEGQEFQQRVRDFYTNLHTKEPERVMLINGENSIDAIHNEISSIVSEKLIS